MRPYSVVENEGFRNMIYQAEPRYAIPSRKTITETTIPDLYKESVSEVKVSLRGAKRIALTCDGWTSRATESYVTVTSHHITDDWGLCSHVLQTRAMYESHTGKNLSDLLNDVTTEWGINANDTALVTDNASNMIVCAELSGFLHIKCFAHTLNLAAQRALKLPDVARLLGRIRRVSTFFHKSTKAHHIFREKQKQLKLPAHLLETDCPTRWNSAYEMVLRFLEQQQAITAALLSNEIRQTEKEISTLSGSDLTNAEMLVKALKPVAVATKVMSDEHNPTVSVIAPLQAQLLQATQEHLGDSPFVKHIKGAIHQDLEKRYTSEREKNTLNLAAALDPRFKLLPFLSEDEKQEVFAKMVTEAASMNVHQEGVVVRSEPDSEQEELSAAAALSSSWSELTRSSTGASDQENEEPQGPPPAKRRVTCALDELFGDMYGMQDDEPSEPQKSPFDCAEEEVKSYRAAAPLNLKQKPLIWWEKHHCEYPLLAELTKRYLCIPGSSVPSERVFSTAGDIVTAQRSCLTSEHVDQLVFLHKNLQVPKH
ncbi:E3 SUMO-protein ligase ZBED1-like [Diretmus argenteus]